MIRSWLAGRPLEDWTAEHFGRVPFVMPDSARQALPLLTWDTVGRLLESGPDMFVVRGGQPSPEPDPRRLEDALRLFAQGYSLVLRACEEHDDGLNRLATEFERDFGGDVQVQAFVTPAGQRSFGWHYDCEDVFIVQTVGTKDYKLRQNTVNPRPTIDAMPRDMRFDLETTPVVACTLVAGDWLYVPRGWWHVGHALDDALSLSTGVLTPPARGGRPPRAPAAARRGN